MSAPALALAPRVRIASTARGRLRGLLFRDPGWLGDGGVLVLVPCRSVHTFGMRRAIDVALVGAGGEVIASRRAVPPGRVLSSRRAVAVLERFACPGRPWPREGERVLPGLSR